jgi:glycosyltransferase involved in cell wall biosynthesis
MHILHISTDFGGSKVHASLYKSLAEQGIAQTIYCPVRSVMEIGQNAFVAKETDIVYDNVIKPYHRYVYHIKRQAIFRSLQNKINVNNVDLCHAATLFTDGGQAYKIYKKYHIPYVVAVRNTDINGFLDLLPHTWSAGKAILRHAEKIFFISNALMEKFMNHRVIQPILDEIRDKMVLVPNGIDDYFLNHLFYEPHSGHRVLYVGDFSSNKNVLRLGEAVLRLRAEQGYEDVTLTLVGGGKNTDDRVQQMINGHPDVFQYLGPIYDKEKLSEVFRTHSLFAMPSIHETFGLVYLEALSQNLPIVYTKGQGVDGLFDDTVGIGVNPTSVVEIKEAIEVVLKSLQRYSNRNICFEQFRWNGIAEKYINLYKQVINQA